MTNYILFLDDEREPADALIATGVEVVVCRNFNEAVSTTFLRGFPSHFCFDHDLGDNSKTGYDFAKWLVYTYLDNEPREIKYSIHSQNPVGVANIKGLLDGYNEFIKKLTYDPEAGVTNNG